MGAHIYYCRYIHFITFSLGEPADLSSFRNAAASTIRTVRIKSSNLDHAQTRSVQNSNPDFALARERERKKKKRNGSPGAIELSISIPSDEKSGVVSSGSRSGFQCQKSPVIRLRL